MEKFNFDGYAELLKNWVLFSQKHLYFCPEEEGLICYGNGTGTNWGMQTHLKAMSSFAVVCGMEEIDLSDFPIKREELLSQTMGMLRYALRTHLEGDFVCTDGEKWGHSWIFALGIERMFHAIEILDKHLTDSDRDMLRRLMISESDFILNDYPIVAGLVENNKPESNIWNGALLYRTAVLYPDAPNKDGYLEKAYRFFANGMSVESDENSDKIVGGMRIGDLFVGANMFDSFACNHHRYLNVGYMNICLSNIAMLHFFLKSRNIEPNEIIYHNLKGQWQLIRSTTFDDGRLLRIGGDTRARYCYCQDYALVGWQLIEDVLGEDCTELENEWLSTLEKETEANGDGSFLSDRFGYFEETSPLYYTRLESDRANAISMAIYWHKRYALDGKGGRCDRISLWKDAYHGAAFVSTEQRFASFTWRAAEYPLGLLVPPGESSLVEWRGNFTGRVFGVGNKNSDDVDEFSVKTFDGGFLTSGTAIAYSDEFGEGQQKELMAKKHIAYAALPDGATVVCLQYAKAINRVFVAESAGIFWNIPNDIYNGCRRSLAYEKGRAELKGGRYCDKFEALSLGSYVNADDKIGLVSSSPITLVREGRRQIDIKGRKYSGTLYCEEICSDYNGKHRWVDRGAILFDTGFAVSLGSTSDTATMSKTLSHLSFGEIKAVSAVGKDGRRYAVVANFAEKDAEFDMGLLGMGIATDIESKKRLNKIVLGADEAVVLVFS